MHEPLCWRNAVFSGYPRILGVGGLQVFPALLLGERSSLRSSAWKRYTNSAKTFAWMASSVVAYFWIPLLRITQLPRISFLHFLNGSERQLEQLAGRTSPGWTHPSFDSSSPSCRNIVNRHTMRNFSFVLTLDSCWESGFRRREIVGHLLGLQTRRMRNKR